MLYGVHAVMELAEDAFLRTYLVIKSLSSLLTIWVAWCHQMASLSLGFLL
jgi:hypothetical protein